MALSKSLLKEIEVRRDRAKQIPDQKGISDDLDLLLGEIQRLKNLYEPELPKWTATLSYRHRAYRNPRFELLGDKDGTYEEVLSQMNEFAENFIKTNFAKGDVELWEVRLRPALQDK